MELQSVRTMSNASMPASSPADTQKNDDFIKVAGAFFELKDREKYDILSVSEKALLQAIEKANKSVQGTPTEFHYKHNEHSSQIIVQILNKDTQEVITEIPSEKMIDLVAKLQELAAGALIDEKR